MGKHSTSTSTPCGERCATGKKGFAWKSYVCVCVVMSCVWCAYSCSEVRRLLGQVQGFSPLPLCCHSWNNWLDYRHLACFTPALHTKAAFSSTLACFFFTPLHWDVKEQEMQKSLGCTDVCKYDEHNIQKERYTTAQSTTSAFCVYLAF